MMPRGLKMMPRGTYQKEFLYIGSEKAVLMISIFALHSIKYIIWIYIAITMAYTYIIPY